LDPNDNEKASGDHAAPNVEEFMEETLEVGKVTGYEDRYRMLLSHASQMYPVSTGDAHDENDVQAPM
jgi:hypothetical protein